MSRLSVFLLGTSIRRRVLLTFITVVIAAALVQLFVAGIQLQDATFNYHQSRLRAHGQDLAAVMAEPLEQYLAEDDDEAFTRVIAAMHDDPYDAYLIFNDQLDLIGSTLSATVDQFGVLTPELSAARETGVGYDIRRDVDGNEHLYVAVPIRYESAYLGYLVVTEDMLPIRAEMLGHWVTLTAAFLPVIVGVVAVGLWVSASIARPIRVLRGLALNMAGGDLTVRAPVQTGDEIGALSHAFNTMAEKLSILVRAQKNFVSNAAHELRTPLMTSALRIEALSDPALDPAQRQVYLDELREEMRHMADLVESLLTISRLEEGRWDSAESTCDGVAVLHDSAREWRHQAAQKGVRLEFPTVADVPDAAIPATDLRLILDNVLGNAVKYTPEGSITVNVLVADGHLCFTVTDTGIGFTPDDGARLFERFFRADTVRHRFIPGTGLGLSVVQTIAQHWGGNIRAWSDGPGLGATVTVLIPAVRARASVPAVERVPA